MANVGPILQRGALSEAVIAAVRDEHADVVIEDRSAYQRILVRDVCRLHRRAIERYLGRQVSFPSDLEAAMISFQGELAIDEELATFTDVVGDLR